MKKSLGAGKIVQWMIIGFSLTMSVFFMGVMLAHILAPTTEPARTAYWANYSLRFDLAVILGVPTVVSAMVGLWMLGSGFVRRWRHG